MMEQNANSSVKNSANVELERNEEHESSPSLPLSEKTDDAIASSLDNLIPMKTMPDCSQEEVLQNEIDKEVAVIDSEDFGEETDTKMSHCTGNLDKANAVYQVEDNLSINSESFPGTVDKSKKSDSMKKMDVPKTDTPPSSDSLCNSEGASRMQPIGIDHRNYNQQNDKALFEEANIHSADSFQSDAEIIDVPVGSDSNERMHPNINCQSKENDTTLSNTTVEEHNDTATKDNNEFGKEDFIPDDPLKKDTASSKNDDDIISTKAAMTMAAVAVAASTSNSSPSAAAEAARALAPDLVPEAISSQDEDLKVVQLSAVKTQMLRKMNQSQRTKADFDEEICNSIRKNAYQRLSLGKNDAFLQHLLLLQYFRVDEEPHQQVEDIKSHAFEDRIRDTNEPMTQSKASVASEKVRSILRMAVDAYDAMDSLLPLRPANEKTQDTMTVAENGFNDAPTIVPDLLPPCISVAGDATHQFFRACLGELTRKESNQSTVPDSESSKNIIENTDTGADEVPKCDAPSHDTPTLVTSEPQKSAASVLTSMFSSMTRSGRTPPSRSSATLASVFRKRNRLSESSEVVGNSIESNIEYQLSQGEYSVSIDREMLGLTVENVLERTVVRTVLPGGAAKKAGAKVGSLIVKVGNVETKNLTHFETIDELRQSQRPLKLVLRQITNEALQSAREEMGRLIRGGGFGTSLPVDQNEGKETENLNGMFRRTHHGKPPNAEPFSQVLHKRWNKSEDGNINRKHEALVHAGEKLVWILTLLIVGLEREAARESTSRSTEKSSEASPTRRSNSFHVAENYSEASKSVSKVVYDFVSQKLLADRCSGTDVKVSNPEHASMTNTANRVRRNVPAQIPASGRMDERARTQNTTNVNTSLLLRIGDVLHRTTTFLADPASPPAALLRGEVISFLCDILDIDTEMELSEEEAGSSTTGSGVAPVNDLGSAGSLLKLVILNSLMMRSPGCQSMTDMSSTTDVELEQEQLRRFGRKHAAGVDLHRFHAGNRFLAVVHRLAASRSTSARVTACSLGPVLWGHLDFPHQLQLRGVITRALHDVDIVVRKSTAAVLHAIAELVFDPRAVPWLVLMCERAMTDPEPQLRAAAMTLTYHLSEHLPNAFLGDASQGSRSLRRLPLRSDPTFAEVYLLQCKLLPVATRLAEDRAPSVRLAVAAQCDRLCNALGEHWYSVIIDMLQALLVDSDEAVRGEAILCVPRLAEIVIVTSTPDRAGTAVLEALLPVSVKLLSDPSSNVRVALATAAGDLLTLLVGLESLHEISPQSSNIQIVEAAENTKTNKAHVDETLIPLLQKLLNDNDPEVTSATLRAVTNASRGNVREIRARKNSRVVEDDSISLSSFQSHASIEKVDPVFIPVLSEEQVMRLIPTLFDLANSRQWRVRQGAVEIVPALLGCTRKLEIRSEVAQLCFRLMNDHVDAVRKTAAECLCLSGGGLGSYGEESSDEWVRTIVIPHVRSCSQSTDSKQRILSLRMIEVLITNGICWFKKKNAHLLSETQVMSPHRELLDIASSLSSDSIANVRLNFGRLVCSLVSILDDEELGLWIKAVQQQIKAEERRESDRDRDVLFFATRAVLRAKERDDMSLPSLHDGP